MKKGILILLLFATFACSEKEEKPKNLLDKVEMANVLTDIIINERIVASQSISLDSAIKTYHGVYLPWLYERHGITEETLNKNFDYYFRKMDEMKKVMIIVQDTLTVRSSQGRLR